VNFAAPAGQPIPPSCCGPSDWRPRLPDINLLHMRVEKRSACRGGKLARRRHLHVTSINTMQSNTHSGVNFPATRGAAAAENRELGADFLRPFPDDKCPVRTGDPANGWRPL